MRLFLAGDYYSETGPAHATKILLQAMPKNTLFQKRQNKLLRIPEIIRNTWRADAVVYSGTSRQVILGINIARLFRKPTFYIMHGSIAYESIINKDYDPNLISTENYILEHIDYILAVSTSFENWLKKTYPNYVRKICHLTNAVDWNLIKVPITSAPRQPQQIMSIGGGMPRKNILSICKAIEILYLQEPECKIRLLIAGPGSNDIDAITSYPFVDYIGSVTHEQVLLQMQQSSLYIQNSIFETFGLAPLEALLCGCNLLLSCHTGALSIITGATDRDIIKNPYDIDELSQKISEQLKSGNHNQLLSSINFETTGPQYRAQELLTLVHSLTRP